MLSNIIKKGNLKKREMVGKKKFVGFYYLFSRTYKDPLTLNLNRYNL